MNTHHMSESNEHYTEERFADSGHLLMGGIDLDPASSVLANTLIKASTFYTRAFNGFDKPWFGRVWLNPPGGICDDQGRLVLPARKGKRKNCRETGECGLPPGHTHPNPTSQAKAWWFKLAREYAEKRVETAVFIGFNLELQQSTQMPCFNSDGMPCVLDFPCCYPRTRMKFWAPNEAGELVLGEQPTHANIIVYLPRTWSSLEYNKFHLLFGEFGRCVWPSKVFER